MTFTEGADPDLSAQPLRISREVCYTRARLATRVKRGRVGYGCHCVIILLLVGEKEVRQKTTRSQEKQGCPLTDHKAVLMLFERSTKVLYSLRLYCLAHGRRGIRADYCS